MKYKIYNLVDAISTSKCRDCYFSVRTGDNGFHWTDLMISETCEEQRIEV